MNSKEIMAESCGLPHLPDELVVEILSRLPVKSLLKFRCVSKLWLSLISSPQFIKTHHQISSRNKEYTHHWLIAFDTSHIKYCSIQPLLLEPVTNATDFDDAPIKCYSRSASIVGSCNGLICIALDCKDVFLWNPSVRKSKKLPESGFVKQHTSYTLFGFGYDESSDDYNVVAIFCVLHGLRTRVKVYSLKSDSWRWIDDVPGYFPFYNFGKFVKGQLHWTGFRGRHDRGIMSLDLSTSRFGQIDMPNCDEVAFYPRLGVLEDCLYVTFENPKNGMDLWVMKDYGKPDSWHRIVKIPIIGRMPLCIWRVSRKNKFFLLFGDTFSLYNSEGMLLRHDSIMNICGCLDAIIYVESLVSPNGI